MNTVRENSISSPTLTILKKNPSLNPDAEPSGNNEGEIIMWK